MGFLMGIGNGNFYSVFDAVWPKKKLVEKIFAV